MLRRPEPEWMDDDQVDPVMLRRSLRFIRRVNSWLGYTRATLGHLERFSQSWRRGQTIHLIDLATGSADVPRAILRWADRRGWDIRIVAVDRHPVTAEIAAEGPFDPRLRIVRADVLDMPFEEGSFDYAISSMFLHHLDDTAAIRMIATMDRLSRRGIIIADLLRGRRAYAWISLFTLLTTRTIRHDGRGSVAQAFNRAEINALRDRAGIAYARYRAHFGHRFVLSGEKDAAAIACSDRTNRPARFSP
jgi:hypothetical protein